MDPVAELIVEVVTNLVVVLSDTSHDASRRQQTPGRQRTASRSQERKVSFDKQNNAAKAALIASQLQEQLGKE